MFHSIDFLDKTNFRCHYFDLFIFNKVLYMMYFFLCSTLFYRITLVSPITRISTTAELTKILILGCIFSWRSSFNWFLILLVNPSRGLNEDCMSSVLMDQFHGLCNSYSKQYLAMHLYAWKCQLDTDCGNKFSDGLWWKAYNLAGPWPGFCYSVMWSIKDYTDKEADGHHVLFYD